MEKKSFKGWLYLLPAFIFVAVFMVYPLVDVFIYAFEEDFNFVTQQYTGIGFGNFEHILKDEYFPDAKVYTDYKELLKDETIDSVDICTPNYLHSIIAVDAFKAGKHVFCEKPDAIDVTEVLKMQKAAEF